MGSTEEEEIILNAEGSDDEEFNKLGISQGSIWSPKLEEIEALYKTIKASKIIELEWKCPGRRDPNQVMEENASESELQQLSSVNDSEADDFAFDEEESPTSLKSKSGSMFKAKTSTKRTTTLAGILSNMERHRIIDRQDTSQGGGGPTPGRGGGE